MLLVFMGMKNYFTAMPLPAAGLWPSVHEACRLHGHNAMSAIESVVMSFVLGRCKDKALPSGEW